MARILRWSFWGFFAEIILSNRKAAAKPYFMTSSAALVNSFVKLENTKDSHHHHHRGVTGQPAYTIASVDLSEKWIDLVRQGNVAATVQLPGQDDEASLSVKYGVRLVKRQDGTMTCQEFVEEGGFVEPGSSSSSSSELVRSINEVLSSFQNEDTTGGSPIKFHLDGDFAAQLQLVRTLRPTPSAGFAGATSAVPPNYDATLDSFVTGPLRLQLRPRVGTLFRDGMTTPWDVYHNISPADTRGHFLLLPTLEDMGKNWRGQHFTADDCNDMVHLAASIEPMGSLFLGYNSVGAAASQNHIHCHAWPCPPLPLIKDTTTLGAEETNEEEVGGWNCYAVSKLKSIYDFVDVQGGKVEVSYLEYPVFCVQLSASNQHLQLLGQSLAMTLEAIAESPHNVGFLNRQQTEEETGETVTFTDVYVFARSRERSSIAPALKLGISEMMGVFHVQSDEELATFHALEQSGDDDTKGPMYQALGEISIKNEQDLWETIVNRLKSLDR